MAFRDKRKLDMGRTINEKEIGMVSVEVILSFTVFILVIAGIIYLTTIFIVHNKVQYAINSAAHELASYTYLYQALGAREAQRTMQKDLDPYADKVDETVGSVVNTVNEISDLYDNSNKLLTDASNVKLDAEYISQLEGDINTIKQNGGAAYESGKVSISKIQERFEDPEGTVVGIIYMAVDGASYYVKSLGARLAARAMTKKYLVQGNRSADEFLKNSGVEKGYEGLDFSGSTIFCDDDYRMIDIVVEYDIHVGFLGLILPDPNFHMVQRASLSGWVGDNTVSKHSGYLKQIKNGGEKDADGMKKANGTVDVAGKKSAEEPKKEEEDSRGAALDEKHFPDATFRNYVTQYDKDKDGFISKEEAAKVKSMQLDNRGITSFEGIENFTELTYLATYGNRVSSIDLSKNTKLKHIDTPDMDITQLDLSNCEPIVEMLESGNYNTYRYTYHGYSSVKLYNDQCQVYFHRSGVDVTAGSFHHDGTTPY